MLLGAPPGRTTRSILATSNKKLLGWEAGTTFQTCFCLHAVPKQLQLEAIGI